MKTLKILLVSCLFLLTCSITTLAATEYPWQGSAKDTERAGGLGWVTVTEPNVLPGTEFVDVRIEQIKGTSYGKWAGEEPADEDSWTIRLYNNDGFSAKVQLPYANYTAVATPYVYPDDMLKDIDIEYRPFWEYSVKNDIYHTPYIYDENDCIMECNISPEHPEGEIKNSLILLARDPEIDTYYADIHYLFGESSDMRLAAENLPGEKEYETIVHPVYEDITKVREESSNARFQRHAAVPTILIGVVLLAVFALLKFYFHKRRLYILITGVILLFSGVVMFMNIKEPESYVERVKVGESIEYIEKETRKASLDSEAESQSTDTVKEAEPIQETKYDASQYWYADEGDMPGEDFLVTLNPINEQEKEHNRCLATGEEIITIEEAYALPEDERLAYFSKFDELNEKISNAFGQYAKSKGWGHLTYAYQAMPGSLKYTEDTAEFTIGISEPGRGEYKPVCSCQLDYLTGKVIIKEIEGTTDPDDKRE